MKRAVVWLAGVVGVAMMGAGLAVSRAEEQGELWRLAQQNLSVHRFSASVKAQEIKAIFRDDEALDKAVAWCRRHGMTRIYLETFRFGYLVERPLLEKVRDGFREGGYRSVWAGDAYHDQPAVYGMERGLLLLRYSHATACEGDLRVHGLAVRHHSD